MKRSLILSIPNVIPESVEVTQGGIYFQVYVDDDQTLEFESVSLDRRKLEASVDGVPRKMPLKPVLMLEMLMINADGYATKDELTNHMKTDRASLRTHASRLRELIPEVELQSVWGRGYKLVSREESNGSSSTSANEQACH